MIRQLFTITGTSPAAAGVAVVGSAVKGLQNYDWFTIDAALVGATGGTLDVRLQRKVALDSEVSGGVWADWLAFPQLTAGASAIKKHAQTGANTTITTVAHGTDASTGTPALTADTFLGGHPGLELRCVATAGASTSAGAAITIYITGWRSAGRSG